MTSSLIKGYRGIVCKWCGSAIEVSQRFALADRPDAEGPHSFSMRCKACAQESVYTVSAIRDFDGEPPRRLARAKNRGDKQRFGAGYGIVAERRKCALDRIASRHGATFVMADIPPHYWFECPFLGAPFDDERAKAVLSDARAAGLWPPTA